MPCGAGPKRPRRRLRKRRRRVRNPLPHCRHRRRRASLPPPPPLLAVGDGGGKIALYAGAAGAVAAGGAAAYLNREQLTEGWTWATSHLEFVGCLAKGEEMQKRVAYMVRVNKELNIGFGNLYTRLGKAASSSQVSMVGTLLPSQRTFCNLPNKQFAGDWKEAVNDAATDETGAHMSELLCNVCFAKS